MRKKLNKKGQGLGDWLLTYGWVIIAVIIAMLVLIYSGVVKNPLRNSITSDTPVAQMIPMPEHVYERLSILKVTKLTLSTEGLSCGGDSYPTDNLRAFVLMPENEITERRLKTEYNDRYWVDNIKITIVPKLDIYRGNLSLAFIDYAKSHNITDTGLQDCSWDVKLVMEYTNYYQGLDVGNNQLSKRYKFKTKGGMESYNQQDVMDMIESDIRTFVN